MLPVAGFVGIGVKDSRGIIAGEARVKANILGVYGGKRNSAVGAGVQAYFYPLKLAGVKNNLRGVYVSAGAEKYYSLGSDNSKSELKSNLSTELGYEVSDNLRLGLGRDKLRFHDDNLTTYLIKVSIKLPKRN